MDFKDFEERVAALVVDHTFKTPRRGGNRLQDDVRNIRLQEGLCALCGIKPAYAEAIYCGAGCSAEDGA